LLCAFILFTHIAFHFYISAAIEGNDNSNAKTESADGSTTQPITTDNTSADETTPKEDEEAWEYEGYGAVCGMRWVRS